MVDDLGLDNCWSTNSTPKPEDRSLPTIRQFATLDAGAGPRHFVLRPDGKFAYVVTEMGHSVTVFSNDAANGKLQVVQTVPTLPKDFKGRNDDAEIQMHPSGKFVYASNRGEDTIAVYAIDGAKGTLTQVASVPTAK